MRNSFVIIMLSVICLVSNKVVGQAVSEEKTAVSSSDSALRALYAEGKSLFLQEDYEKAAACFSELLALRPNLAAAYNDRGSCNRMLGRYEQALVDYTEAIKYRPCAAYYCNRGSVRVKMEDYDAAISDYTLAHALDTNYYQALNNRGIVYLNTGSYRRAVEDFTACIRLKPDYYLLYNNRGIAYYKLKEFELSFADFNKTISLNGEYGNAYLHRGNIREMLDDDAGACEDWSRALALGVKQAEKCLENCKN